MNRSANAGPLTATIVGGLGNQMFIAAFARLAAESSGRPLILDTTFYRHRAAGRHPELLAFAGWSGFGETSDWRGDLSRVSRAFSRRLHAPAIREFREHDLRPFTVGFDERSSDLSRFRRVSGYFQSWRYFSGHEKRVREMFTLAEPETVQATIHQAVGADFMGIHVRRGDYTAPAAQKTFGLCSPEYYLRAIAMAQDRLQSRLPVVLFSDAPDEVPHDLLSRFDHVVKPDRTRPVAHDLVALSSAQALVLSNSSFSWWAAYLRNAADRPVIVPKPWFRVGNSADADLLLPEWISVDARYGA